MKKIAAVLAIAGFAFAGQASATVNLVVNGSFEQGHNLGVGTWGLFDSLPGWTRVGGPKIEVQTGVAGQASDGKSFVELDSTANSKIFQKIAVEANHTYKFFFDYSARPGVSEESNEVGYSFAGMTQSIRLTGIGYSNTHWATQPNAFWTADADGFVNIAFWGLGSSNSLGGYVDNVNLIDVTAPVPEPETYAMLGLGLLAIGVARRRKAV